MDLTIRMRTCFKFEDNVFTCLTKLELEARYYISLQMDVARDLMYITLRCIYSKLLITLFLN